MSYLDQGLTPRAGELPTPRPASRMIGTEAEPGYLESAFALNNPVVSGIQYWMRPSWMPDPTFDTDKLLGLIQGTRYEQNLDSFVGVRSEAETRAVMSRIDTEQEYIDSLSRGGKAGWIMGMAAGLVDPLIAVPLVGYIRPAVTAGRVARGLLGAAEGAVVSGTIAAAEHALIEATHDEPSPVPAAFSIGIATILGGVIGGTCCR